MELRNRHRRTLQRIFASPTPPDIRWAELVSLLRALDMEIIERAGSRVSIARGEVRLLIHRPHPRPYISQATARSIATFLSKAGVGP